MELEGKIINFLGDSITQGVGVAHLENRYDQVMLRECRLLHVNNYGVGGTRLAHQTQPSTKARWDLNFCGRAYDMTLDADIIVVYGGVNDYFHGDAPLGQPGDITRATFYGAVHELTAFLRERYPRAVLVFMTPAHAVGDQLPSHSVNKPVGTKRELLCRYIEAIEYEAPRQDFRVLNLWEKLGLDPNDSKICAQYTADGVHFNDEGHRIIARTLTEFLQQLPDTQT